MESDISFPELLPFPTCKVFYVIMLLDGRYNPPPFLTVECELKAL